MTLSPLQRAFSLAAVIAASFGVGVAFGVGFPLTALTLEAWHEPKWVIGLAGAAPAVAIILTLPFLPRLAARLGAVTAIAAGCAVAGLCFLALSQVDTAVAWIALRFLMSAGIALPWLVGETWINTVAVDGMRGRIIALYAIAFFSGFSGGSALLDWLSSGGIAPFIAGAAGAILAGVPIMLARKLAPDLTHDSPKNMSSALRLAPVGMMCGFIGGFAEIGYLSLLPNVAIACNLDQSEALWLLSIATVGGGILQVPVGWLADKVDKILICVVLAVLFIALTLALPSVLMYRAVAPVAVFLLGGIILGFYTLGLSIVGDSVAAKDLSAANAAFLVMYQVGSILGPIAAGAAMTFDPVAGFIGVIAGLMSTSIILLLLLARRVRSNSL